MPTILLARHGETDWNRDSRFQGHADPPLNERGRAQARELARRLNGQRVLAVYTSPLQRARETADIVAARFGLPVEAVEGLREVDVGSWTGLTRAEVERRFPDGYARWLDYGPGWDGGETYEQMGERVVTALREIAARHAEGVILLVSHGGPIRAAQAYAAGISYSEARRQRSVVANCGFARLVIEADAMRAVD